MGDRRFAVLIDGDNIPPKYLSAILSEVGKFGSIVIRRIYGDWTTPNMNGWKELLAANPIRPFQQFRYGEDATDGALVMDAIELLSSQSTSVDAYCIVSSDGGFYSVALRLREYGKFVLGIGRSNTKELFKNACNQFVTIENIYAPTIAEKPTESSSIEPVDRLLVEKPTIAANLRMTTGFHWQDLEKPSEKSVQVSTQGATTMLTYWRLSEPSLISSN